MQGGQVSAILKTIIKIIWVAIKAIDWKPVIKDLFTTDLLPWLEAKAKESTNTLDDKGVQFIKDSVDKYLGVTSA